MARRKRPYVPKVKGCYECSQRRIDCDRTDPACNKCSSRGLSCSGFGVKYRFRNGFAPGPRTITTTPRKRSTSSNSYASTTSQASPASIQQEDGDQPAENYDIETCADGVNAVDDPGRGAENDAPDRDSPGVSGVIVEYKYESQTNLDEPPASPTTTIWRSRLSLGHQLGLISPSKRLLLKHFSHKIAPEMVVIDGQYNGWRHLVLPIALADDLVMSAVLAASAFHLWGTMSTCSSIINTDTELVAAVNPAKLYAQAIQKLQQRRQLDGCDAHARQMVILAIVVLLVAVMINGCSDFPVMFRMLQSAIDAIGGEAGLMDGGEVAEFSLRQIRKMRVYAAPLLSLDDGLYAITSQASQSFDCLYYYRRLYPEYSSTFDMLANLRQQAFNIYLERVLNPADETQQQDSSSSSSTGIKTFIRTLESFPPGSLGEHALVWSCFIAASESREPEHKLVLHEFLSRQYVRNGFANILIALDLLQRIWARSSNADWPALLPGPQVFIM